MSIGVASSARTPFLMVAFIGAVASGCRRRSRIEKGESPDMAAELKRYIESGNDLLSFRSTENKLTAKLSSLAEELRTIQKQLTLALSTVEAHRLFSPERLSTAEGIASSMEEAERLRTIDKWYFGEAERKILEFDTWALEEFGRSLGEQPRMHAETRELLEKSIAVHESISRLLVFVQSAKPRLDESGGVLLFESPLQAARYTSLLQEIERRSAMLESRQSEILQSRQRSAQQGLSYLAA
jgi:hypothetical protein